MNLLKKIKTWFTNKIYEPKESGTSAGETLKYDSSFKQIVERHDIKDTPFTIVKVDKWWYLMMGKYRLTNQLTSKKEAEAEANDASWMRIMQIINICILEHEAEQREKQKQIWDETETRLNDQLNKTMDRQKNDTRK